MKRPLILPFCLLLLLAFAACRQEEGSQLKKTDLLRHGLPVTILAPDSAEIKAQDLAGIYLDITVKGSGNYSLQILASQAETSDIAKIKAGQLAEVKGNRYFKRIVREEEDGFLYETAVDEGYINYGFRYIALQGEQEIVFQPSLTGQFSLEEAERMYEAVQQRKR
jgi:hypothetical protein